MLAALALLGSTRNERTTRPPRPTSARARKREKATERLSGACSASSHAKSLTSFVNLNLHCSPLDKYRSLNALVETINSLYKAEVIWRQRSWPNSLAVEMPTLRWIDWFNNHRLFGPIGHIPPAEAEANYDAARETLDMVESLR
jgi:hypothetical protein